MENNECELSEDMTIEILQYLPLRSLARMNCVSKLWRNYVSSKCHLYSCRSSLWGSPLIRGFFFRNSFIGRYAVPIHFFSSSKHPPGYTLTTAGPFHHFLYMSYQIVASSNGLLLCARSDQNPHVHYCVHDPGRNLGIVIPKPKNIFTSVKIGFHSEPNNEPHSICFTFVRFGLWDLTSIEIYSSEKGAWMYVTLKIEVPHPLVIPFEGPPAAFLDGVFYWLDVPSEIYAFDLLNNKLLKVESPPESKKLHSAVFSSRRLDAAGGSLHMTITNGVHIKVWVHKGRDSIWVLKHRLRVQTLIDNNANILNATELLAAAGSRFLGIIGFQPSDPQKLIFNTLESVFSYDLGSGKLELIYSFHKPCSDVNDFTFFPYEFYERPRLI